MGEMGGCARDRHKNRHSSRTNRATSDHVTMVFEDLPVPEETLIPASAAIAPSTTNTKTRTSGTWPLSYRSNIACRTR